MKKQNPLIAKAIQEHKLRTGQLAYKRTRSIHPDNVITKKLFEKFGLEYKTKN
jgi:hypothetical protein